MTASPLDGFDAFVGRVLRDWEVPGAGVAVVQGTDVLFARGFGLRDVERNLTVDEGTLFPIASCTKAFTTASMSVLVDEGRLDWDTPVREYLPWFTLRDPVVSERITPRDLVTHRSGLPRHDLVWYGRRAAREELVRRMRHLEPSKDLRTTYQYNNLMYTAAGYLVGTIAGEAWESFARTRLLEPLDMKRTTFSVSTLAEDPNASLGYAEKDDTVKQVPFRNLDAICPAGGINSCVAELSRWVIAHLNGGRLGERLVLSEAQLAEMHAGHMVMPETDKYPELPPLAAYGLGWRVRPYRGHVTISHTGGSASSC